MGGARHTSNVISGFFWIRQLSVMARISSLLGESDAAANYASRASIARASFVENYFDPVAGIFRDPHRSGADGSSVLQTENALSLSVENLPISAQQRAGVVAAIAKDVAAHGGHLETGMIGIKYILPALSKGGQFATAMSILTQTSFPSYGYMYQHGEGSLWERWSGDEHTCMGSRNRATPLFAPYTACSTCLVTHPSVSDIMLGSAGQWFYQGIAGITLDDTADAWSTFTVSPEISEFSVAQHGILGVDATHSTVRGDIIVSTRFNALLNGTVCGSAAEGSEVPGTSPNLVRLDCGNQSISEILFASYGDPLGNCTAGFSRNPACDASSSTSRASGLCLGKSSCVIASNNTEFGMDPCPGQPKRLAVVAKCGGGCQPVYRMTVTIPAGTTATVRLPVPESPNSPPPSTRSVLVSVDDGIVIFSNGTFKPTAPGVFSASFIGDEAIARVSIALGSGSYSLVSHLCVTHNHSRPYYY